MEKEILKEPNFIDEIIEIIRSDISDEELRKKLDDFHENDIAQSLEFLSKEERIALYGRLGNEFVSEIFSFLDEPEKYADELSIEKLAEVIQEMDSDDAVDMIDEIDDETVKKLAEILDEETVADIRLIRSYEDDEMGSLMTTNYIYISKDLTVPQAMTELKAQAGENDNISTIYVYDEEEKFYGALELRDLIIARRHSALDALISQSYPYVGDHEKISDCIERIKDYAEESLPVLNDKHELLGIITSQDIIETVDDEMGDDYAKLAGLTSEEDLEESLIDSMKKRLPWLIILMVLGLGVSSVIGLFDGVVAAIPVIMCFQSLILDMAGNVGTQSLAVTIRVLMDEELKAKDKIFLVFKEARVGFINGVLIAAGSLVFVAGYLKFLKGYTIGQAIPVAICVAIALILAMVISSLMGTLIPMFFHKIKVDPAVASGPLITTVNDLVAVVSYYGIAWILLINVTNMH